VNDATIFTALADPMRRKLLVNLAENSPKTATQLAKEYPRITRQGILKHLNILEDAGLVAAHRKGREKRYTLTPEPLGELEQWIKEIGAKWDERLLRLKTFLENEAAGAGESDDEADLPGSGERRDTG
jgi:DNA-binding transcriptional ArsR family regulator